jgi:hypothetical protein
VITIVLITLTGLSIGKRNRNECGNGEVKMMTGGVFPVKSPKLVIP